MESLSELSAYPPEFVLPGSRLPFPRNPHFTGREGELSHLAYLLLDLPPDGPLASQHVVIVAGEAGIGKTSLAVEFCYRYGHLFTGVHWVRANQDPLSEIAACGGLMNLLDWPATVPERARRTQQVWITEPLRLVVLDQVEEPFLVAQFLARLPNVAILITARSDDWPHCLMTKVHPLGGLAPSDSRALLLKLAPRLASESPEALETLVARLENQPAALALAGCHLAQDVDLSLPAYLLALQKECGEAPETTPAGLRWALPAASTVFALARQRLEQLTHDSIWLSVFRVCGYAAPGLPLCLELVAEVARVDPPTCQRNLEKLQAWGWLDTLQDQFVITPLLSEQARWLDQQHGEDVLSATVEGWRYLLSSANPGGPLPLDDVNRIHLRTVAEMAEKHGLRDVGELWHTLGRQLEAESDFGLAKAYFNCALKNDQYTYGPIHIRVAINLTHLAEIALQQESLLEAEADYEQALRIYENVVEPDHPLRLTVLRRLYGLHTA